MAAPIPRDPPVTKATFDILFSSNLSGILLPKIEVPRNIIARQIS
jgi:hypothetical protein